MLEYTLRTRLVFFLLFAGAICMHAEDTPNPFSRYNYSFLTEDAGLPHNFVDDIYKDSQDYIWAATRNGLVRYDGYTFLTFTSSTTPIALKSNFVHKICEDNFNRLWVASEGGIDVIDLQQYSSVDFFFEKYSPLWNMMNSNTLSIYKDGRGDLWISSENTLHCIEFNHAGAISGYFSLEEGTSTLPVNTVIDVGWSVCAGINNSIQRIDKRTDHLLKSEPVSELVTAPYDDWRIHCMETDGDLLWIGTNRGLFKYDHFAREIKRYRYSSTRPGMLSQSHITDIKLNKNGKLFVSTLNGLNVYNREADTFSFTRQSNDHKLNSLNCNFINCILPDGDNIWVGTEIGGINLLTSGRLVTQSWQHDKTDKHSLSPNPVNAICEDREGNLWVGTVEGGINIKRKGKNTFEHIVADESNPYSLSHNSVCDMLLDTDNHLWVCTWGLGVSELDLNVKGNKRFNRYYRGITEGMEGNFVASACEDTINKGIWFGTTEGLHFYDKLKKEFAPVKFGFSDNSFETMSSLLIDNKNRLWAGTSRGLFIIDIFSFARSRLHFDYTHIKNKLSDPNSDTTDKINCVIQDKDGCIWLGGNGSGLYQLISDKNGLYTFRNYTMRDGLPNNNIIGIVEDNNKCLWLSTNQGISKLDKQSMTFTNYNKYDGLLTNQFYWNAFYFSEQQNLLYFGNTEGLVAIDPNVNDDNILPARVSLTSLSILGKTIYPSSGSYMKRDISTAEHIRLHESDKTFSINFSAKDYGYNGQERYSYRLEGYDEEWIEPRTGEHTARYTSLPPGKYIFQVRVTDSKGHWSDHITGLNITVTPYFYKSWWFFTLLLLLTLISINRYFAWKTHTYRRQKTILEETVKQRTTELAVKNKKLVEMSRRLANTTEEKIAFFTNITHEFRTPVTLIHGPLEQALKANQDPNIMEQLEIAERNSRYLLELVNELMDFRKIEANKLVLEKKSGNFGSFIENQLISFKAFARDRNITLRLYNRLDAGHLVFDYEYMRKVIINLLSNAIKFTPDNGVIKIYVATVAAKEGKKIYICVQDSGGGIAGEDMEKIFERIYQSRKSVKYPVRGQSSTGIGLFLCKRIIKLHGGTIKACNNKNKGASFRILLPCVAGEQTREPVTNTAPHLRPVVKPAQVNQSETILVVDDNADMRSYIRSLLSPLYRIIEAPDGAEALNIIQTQPVDLILSDLMMPVMDGHELSQRVKENLAISHIPFLMLTAVVSEEQKKKSYRVGVDEYLCKPFDEDILLLRIRNIFAQREKYKLRFAVNMNTDVLNIHEESKDKKFMNKAIALMKENVGNAEYEVDHFVKDMGYSKTLVNTKLHELAGQTIGQFIRGYRLNTAHEILINLTKETDINVSEIAYTVGFNDPKYFTRCFKEFFGVLPSSILAQKK